MKTRSVSGSRAIAASILFAIASSQAAMAQLSTQSLADGLTPQDLVDTLVGVGPTAPIVSNISFTGHATAGGTFTGGLASGLGFEGGIILSTGNIHDVVAVGGMNNSDATTTNHGLPGDPDLNALIPQNTFDAAVLEFDFECEELQVISFQYRFASEEYNEYVNTQFNDVFAFFVNGVNVALLPDGVTPVSINNVNCGNPIGDPTPSNCAFFVNNSCHGPPGEPNLGFPCVPPAIMSEMDGFTVVLTATAVINPGINHIKLAIADAGDHILDSVVFLQGGSFVCEPPPDLVGACCLPDGSCEELTFDECADAGGLFNAGAECDEVVCDPGCVLSQGYWKNHPQNWPVDDLMLGNHSYNKMELLATLHTPVRGNGLVSLSYQLIAAQLNQANGALTPPAVQQAIDDAHALIGNLVVPPHGNGHIHPSHTGSLISVLDAYNNGLAPGGPPHCDD